jgi:hypothetical protein
VRSRGPTGSGITQRTQGGRGTSVAALASRFWGLGCPKIYHEVAARFTIVDFLIVAFAIFVAIKVINTLKRKEEAAPAVPPKPSNEELLLSEIRDLLKTK